MNLFLHWTDRKEYSTRFKTYLGNNLFEKEIISYVVLPYINSQV